MAETRGRYRMGDDLDQLGDPPAPEIRRAENALPLAGERSAAEQRIEIERVTKVLAGQLGVDPECRHLTGQPARVASQLASERLTDLGRAVDEARRQGPARQEWRELTDFFYGWDAFIQDRLAAGPFGTSSAYQLGRGVGEVFWALDPTVEADDDARGWSFLLGQRRVAELRALLQRLGAEFPPLTADAMAWSLDRWAEVAHDPTWRGMAEAIPALAAQSRLWRDLLLIGRDPVDLVDPALLVRRARRIWPLVRSFVPELGLLAAGIGLLTAAAAVLGGSGGHQAQAAVLAVLGTAGVSGAGLAGKLKDAATQLLGHLRTEFQRDVARIAVTLRPERTTHPPRPRPAPTGAGPTVAGGGASHVD